MPSDNYHEILARAARLWGIDAEYWDIWGQKHITPPETEKGLLTALGVPAGDKEQLERALLERERREWSRLLRPCTVLSENQRPKEALLHVPEALAGSVANVEVHVEGGNVRSYEISLGELPQTATAEFDGTRFQRKQLPLPIDLPLGYHEVEVSVESFRGSMRLIIAPDRAYLPETISNGERAAGLAVQLYGLRSQRNWGCGDFRDLKELISWVAGTVGASFVALNPLHAIHNRRPFNTSPYLPNCVFYQNSLYLDLEAIEEFNRSTRVRRLWASPEVCRELEELRNSEFVEYERVHALKLRFLKLLFLTFLRREYRKGTARATEFRAFVDREGELLDRYATYSALDELIHARQPDIWVWPQWPVEYQDPDSSETQAFRSKYWRRVLFYKYVQWQIDRQLGAVQKFARDCGLPIGLYHDLALATDHCGSDLWAHRPFFVSGCRVGSPPDDFSPQGQDWAFPPPHSEEHRENGYRLFTESIRKNCRHGGALRIDHVMRFFRLYWIPDGVDAAHGTYVRDHYEDLVRIVALESVRNRVVVVGEDLGTVEPFVRETLARFGILSYRLFYFEKDQQGNFRGFRDYPTQALVSSTTHDLPTLAGFWINEDIEARRRAGVLSNDGYHAQLAARAGEKQRMLDLLFNQGLLPDHFSRSAADIPELTGELHNAVIGFLASTPSMLLVVNQEDLTKETEQQNLPGTTSQYPNWSRKMRFTLEQLHTDPMAHNFTLMFRNWLERTGRLNRETAHTRG